MKTAFGISNGYAPAQGPKGLPGYFDFTNSATVEFDLLQEETSGVIQNPQSIYIDNSQNRNSLVLTFGVTNQRLSIPAYASGIWPIFSADQLKVSATSVAGTIAAGGAGQVYFIILNVPMPLTQWGPISVSAELSLTRGEFANFGMVTAGGVSEEIIPANLLRKRIVIVAAADNAESIWINFADPAANDETSFELIPGGSYDTNFGPVTTQAINVFSVTGGMKIAAKEM